MAGDVEFYRLLADRVRALGFEVKELTPYQYRINGVLDLYPVNLRWHDIQRNERGTYNDMLGFARKFFGTKLAASRESDESEDAPIVDLWGK